MQNRTQYKRLYVSPAGGANICLDYGRPLQAVGLYAFIILRIYCFEI